MEFISKAFTDMQNNSQLVTYFVASLLVLNLLLFFILSKKLNFSAKVIIILLICLSGLWCTTLPGRIFWLNGWGWHDWFLFINIGLLAISTFHSMVLVINNS